MFRKYLAIRCTLVAYVRTRVSLSQRCPRSTESERSVLLPRHGRCPYRRMLSMERRSYFYVFFHCFLSLRGLANVYVFTPFFLSLPSVYLSDVSRRVYCSRGPIDSPERPRWDYGCCFHRSADLHTRSVLCFPCLFLLRYFVVLDPRRNLIGGVALGCSFGWGGLSAALSR